jgi:hypothetical protein
LTPLDAHTAGAKLVREQIRKRLGADTKVEVALAGFVMSGPMHGRDAWNTTGPGRDGADRHAMANRFIVQARLKDRSWVWFERRIPRELCDWPAQMPLTLLILLAGVISTTCRAWSRRPSIPYVHRQPGGDPWIG